MFTPPLRLEHRRGGTMMPTYVRPEYDGHDEEDTTDGTSEMFIEIRKIQKDGTRTCHAKQWPTLPSNYYLDSQGYIPQLGIDVSIQ